MANIDTKPLATSIIEAVSNFLSQHDASHQAVQAASEALDALSSALDNVRLPSVPITVKQFEHELDWKELHKFIQTKRRDNPYPLFLHRAHMHGELFPRFIDDMTEEYCDTFASDEHLRDEWESQSESWPSLPAMENRFGIEDFAKEVANHLVKTQVNKGRKSDGSDYHFSPFLSFSGDLRWTLHNSFRKHLMSRNKQEQISGLAIFDTTKLFEAGEQLFRVSDLLLFLDSNKRFGGSAIDERARYWAANADEYLCWDVAPKAALVAFIPCDEMTDTPEAPDKSFLRLEFRTFRNLASFRNEARKSLSIDDYIRRVLLFSLVILGCASPNIDEDRLIDHLIENLDDPLPWGYALDADKIVIRERLTGSRLS